MLLGNKPAGTVGAAGTEGRVVGQGGGPKDLMYPK